uniref:S1 motif domain-containing protein n=1 Tax=Romanomermis culicivorax TaxID=13658 RepID=A0A915K7E5_ROMCU
MPNEFPFATRLACEVLESNGSSSMASVCAGSLALMDGGIPIKAPAAGVAIGLMYNLETEDKDYKILTDINGLEDYSGDMDFKIAGTRHGLTALQLDVKHSSGLSLAMVEESLLKAFVAVNEVLDITGKKGLFSPRPKMKDNGPAVEEFVVPVTKRYRMIRMGGYNLRHLESELGVQISQIDQQTYRIFAPNQSLLSEAKESLNQMLERGADQAKELEFGAIYKTKIVDVLENGLSLTLRPGSEPIFMPNSQLDLKNVKHASALNLKVNDELMVKYFGRDPVTGAIRLSRKLLLKTSPSPAKLSENITGPKAETRQSPWAKSSSN